MGRLPFKAGTQRLVNGYSTIKQPDGSWKYEHHIIAEEKLGRPIEANERVCFIDGNRENLDPANIEIRWKLPPKEYQRQAHLRRKVIQLRSRLKELEDQLETEEGPIAKEQEGRGGQSYEHELAQEEQQVSE